MRIFFLSILLFQFAYSFSQSNRQVTTKGIAINQLDTCRLIDSCASFNLIIKTRHPNPLCVANGIIVRLDFLTIDTTLISSIEILKCPASFNKYGYIGYNGTILIKTKQNIEIVTPSLIKESKFKKLKGNILFAINGDLINDTSIKISTASIKEIELLKAGQEKGENKKFNKYSCINIWTLTKEERKPMTAMCRGIGVFKN